MSKNNNMEIFKHFNYIIFCSAKWPVCRKAICLISTISFTQTHKFLNNFFIIQQLHKRNKGCHLKAMYGKNHPGFMICGLIFLLLDGSD